MFPSISDCVQRHSHAGKEDTYTFREEILHPLWEEESGTGLMLPLQRCFAEHKGTLMVFVALCDEQTGVYALKNDGMNGKGVE